MGDPNKALRHMADTVSRYIEHYDNIFGKGGPGMHEMPPMNRKEKGVSRPALTPAAIRYIENPKNRRTAHVLEPLIAELSEVPRSTYLGYDLYSLVCRCGYNTTDHGYLRNLLSPQSYKQRMELEAWHFARWKIATKALKRTGGAGLEVVVNPKPLKGLDEEDDATPLVKSGAKHHRNRRYTYEHTARKRYERVQEIRAQEKCSEKAAVSMMADEEDIGMSTAWEAVKFAERKPA